MLLNLVLLLYCTTIMLYNITLWYYCIAISTCYRINIANIANKFEPSDSIISIKAHYSPRVVVSLPYRFTYDPSAGR